jgi:hypothetical protein
MVPRPSFRNALRASVADAALFCIAAAAPSFASAQDSAYDPANYAWQAGAISHAQRMRVFVDPDSGQQPTPPVIPQFEIDFDPSGILATTQPGGSTQTSLNAFSQISVPTTARASVVISHRPVGASARRVCRGAFMPAMEMIRYSG